MNRFVFFITMILVVVASIMEALLMLSGIEQNGIFRPFHWAIRIGVVLMVVFAANAEPESGWRPKGIASNPLKRTIATGLAVVFMYWISVFVMVRLIPIIG